jgi:hypothetical protein
MVDPISIVTLVELCLKWSTNETALHQTEDLTKWPKQDGEEAMEPVFCILACQG